MSFMRTSATALLLSTALTPAAWAELTADSVWQQMTEISKTQNMELSAESSTRDGNTLVLRGITGTGTTVQSFEVADEKFTIESTTTISFDELSLTEERDGTVTLDMSDKVALTSTTTGDDEPVSFGGTMEMADYTTTFREDGDALVVDQTAGTLAFVMDSLPDEEDVVFNAPLRLEAQGLTGTTSYVIGDDILTKQDYDINAVRITADVTATDDEDETANIVFDGTMETLKLTGDSTIPADLDMSDPMAVYSADMSATGSLTMAGQSHRLVVEGGDADMDLSFKSGPYTMSGGLENGTVRYEDSAQDVAIDVTTQQMPFPVNVTLSELGSALTLPMTKSDAPSDARLGLKLKELQVNDMIWAMLDPQGALPHDPATLEVDLSGQVMMLANLTDPQDMEALMETGSTPFLPINLRLDTLLLDVVGARLTGDGAVDFDQTDLTSYDGLPAPIGDVTLNATGVNGLIDRLIQMGLLPEDQAMMSRMMIGMFTNATGDDALTSHIEFQKGGRILANGQQIR